VPCFHLLPLKNHSDVVRSGSPRSYLGSPTLGRARRTCSASGCQQALHLVSVPSRESMASLRGTGHRVRTFFTGSRRACGARAVLRRGPATGTPARHSLSLAPRHPRRTPPAHGPDMTKTVPTPTVETVSRCSALRQCLRQTPGNQEDRGDRGVPAPPPSIGLTGTLTPNPPAVQEVPPTRHTTSPIPEERDLLHYRQNRCPRRAPRQRMTEDQGPRAGSMIGGQTRSMALPVRVPNLSPTPRTQCT
jgi:hypothetical protein